jgi:hypothetical protein
MLWFCQLVFSCDSHDKVILKQEIKHENKLVNKRACNYLLHFYNIGNHLEIIIGCYSINAFRRNISTVI